MCASSSHNVHVEEIFIDSDDESDPHDKQQNGPEYSSSTMADGPGPSVIQLNHRNDCPECARAIGLTLIDKLAQRIDGSSPKPEHVHCHECQAVARVEWNESCSACGYHFGTPAQRARLDHIESLRDITDRELEAAAMRIQLGKLNLSAQQFNSRLHEMYPDVIDQYGVPLRARTAHNIQHSSEPTYSPQQIDSPEEE